MCALCHRFINAEGENTAASAAVSCSGYDIDLNISSLAGALDLAEEVTDVTSRSNLYLLNVGYQRCVLLPLSECVEAVHVVPNLSSDPES